MWQHADAVLGNAILMVRINATKQDGLLALSDFLEKSHQLEDVIISMIVLDGDATFASMLFKRSLGEILLFQFLSFQCLWRV